MMLLQLLPAGALSGQLLAGLIRVPDAGNNEGWPGPGNFDMATTFSGGLLIK